MNNSEKERVWFERCLNFSSEGSKSSAPFVWPSIRRQTLSGEIVVRGFTEMLRSMTPYERDCMAKVNYAQADREPVDPHAKKVFEAAVEYFDATWMEKMRQRWRETPNVADIVESCNREPMKWPNVRWG